MAYTGSCQAEKKKSLHVFQMRLPASLKKPHISDMQAAWEEAATDTEPDSLKLPADADVSSWEQGGHHPAQASLRFTCCMGEYPLAR